MSIACANGQEDIQYRLVGAPCEGCEAVFEYGDRELNSIDTLPNFNITSQKLKISGTIFQPDAKTPAENVILYLYHTDSTGVYPTTNKSENWERRHGYLRGWIKTGKDGKYTFYTSMPAGYPNAKTPSHIHPTILEPDGRYYYLSEILFKNDMRLTEEHFMEDPRGTDNMLVNPEKLDGLLVINKDFILGKNVPGYEK